MPLSSYIALDLETTGLDPRIDRIFEYACIHMVNGKPEKTLEGLVNPGVPIPNRITAITGITDDDVREKPLWETHKENITTFIDNHPVVAHNAPFDRDMLQSHGIPLTKNLIFDTHELAQIFLKQQRSASLESFTHHLDIEHKERHRAKDDAHAAAFLLQKILEAIEHLPHTTSDNIAAALVHSAHPLKTLFPATKSTIAIAFQGEPSFSMPAQQDIAKKLDADMQRMLQPRKKPLLIEIGPGKNRTIQTVGAALGYDGKVIYSFATRAREQKIQEALTALGVQEVRVDHPNQFFCKKRFDAWRAKKPLTNDAVSFLVKLLVWLPRTTNGERRDVWLRYGEESFWYAVAAEESCHTKEAHEGCFFQQQKGLIEKSRFVTAHHSVLVADTKRTTPILPASAKLIIDDADHFEHSVNHALTETLTERRLQAAIPAACPDAQTQLPLLLGRLGMFYQEAIDPTERSFHLVLGDRHKNTKKWKEAEQATASFLTLLAPHAETMDDDQKKTCTLLKTFILTPEANVIRWITILRDGMPILKMAPADIAQTIQAIYDRTPPTLIIGDSMRMNQSFDAIARLLALPASVYETAVIPPEPTRARNIELIIPKTLPPPGSEGYTKETIQLLRELIKEKQGGILAIFAAKQGLEASFDALHAIARRMHVHLFAETCTGSRRKVVDQFLREPEQSVLFLLTGRGFPEEMESVPLHAVLIQKIPFDSPNDPITKARSATYADPFQDYQVPKAGFRLLHFITSLMDRAEKPLPVYLFDTRLLTKDYGKIILASLPEGITTHW